MTELLLKMALHTITPNPSNVTVRSLWSMGMGPGYTWKMPTEDTKHHIL